MVGRHFSHENRHLVKGRGHFVNGATKSLDNNC